MYGATLVVTTRDLLLVSLSRLAILGSLCLVLSASIATAQYCTPDQCDECDLCSCSQRCCHELPELWLINTRCAPRCKNLDSGFDCLIYKRYDRQCCRWVQESRESFLAQESSKPTLFYSHGNSLNHKNAMKSCWQVYCKMRCCPGPKRLVFWSWPAERVYKTERLRVRKMIEKNLRIKYVYAEYQGYYMAKLVNQMSLSQRVMMSGHSYGAITTSAAAHLLGGGCLRGLTLEGGAPVERPNLRVAAISGAFDHDMLNPGKRYGQAFVAAEKVFVTRNIKDRTLKKWPKTSWRGCRAIGVLGVNANCLGEYRNKLCQKTMTSDVGTSHYLKPHLKSVRFVAALCCLSFPECTDCSLTEATLPTEDEIASDTEVPSEDQLVDVQAVEEQPTFDGEPTGELDFTFDNSSYDNEQLDFSLNHLNNNSTEFDMMSLQATHELNPVDIADIFGDNTPTAAAPKAVPQIARSNAFKPAAVPTLADPVPTLADPVPTLAPPREESSQSKALVPTPADEADATNASNQRNVWYRFGLCLAIVLTGQFYVLFGKRVPTA